MTVQAAAKLLAEHYFIGRANGNYPGRCACGDDGTGEPLSPDPQARWRGLACDHPAHQADVLAQAGLLRDAPVTPRTFQDAPD